MMEFDKEVLRKLSYNTSWDGTCGSCGNSVRWCPKYGNMEKMRRTFCTACSVIGTPHYKNLIDKKSQPKWCPRIKEMKTLGLI